MERITQDYHHILKVHIREGDKTCIENCFRYFDYAVHFEDEPAEIEQCRSAKRKEDRMHDLSAVHQKHDYDGGTAFTAKENTEDIDIWALRQHYVQSQLDIIHSYLVHSKWKRFVQRYSQQPMDEHRDHEHKYETDNEEEEDDLLLQNAGKYITDIEDSDTSQYGFGIDHDHP
eukprot:717032_1